MEDDVGRACGTYGAKRNTERVLKERSILEDLGVERGKYRNG
jgi:hypothetical protein